MTQEQLKEALAQAEADLKAFKEPISELENQRSELEKGVDSMLRDEDEIRKVIDSLIVRIEELTTQRDGESDPDVQAKIQTEIDSVSAEKDGTEAKLAQLRVDIKDAKEKTEEISQSIFTWRDANEAQLEVLEGAVHDIQNQIVTPDQQIWTKIGETFNAGLEHLDTKNNDQLDKGYFVASGLVQEAKQYADGQLERTDNDYTEAYVSLSEEQKNSLRATFNQYITEVFQAGGDNAAMEQLFTEDLFASWVSSGESLADYFAKATIEALRGFFEFEVQQGQEGDLKSVYTTAYRDSIILLEETKANLESRIASTTEIIAERTQKHEAEKAKMEEEMNALKVEHSKLKEEIEAANDALEDAIGTPEFTGAAATLYKLETEGLETSNSIQSLEVQMNNNQIAHDMTISALESGKSNFEEELAETNKEKAAQIASIEALIFEYTAAKDDQEKQLAETEGEKAAREEKSEIIKAELTEVLGNTSKIFDEIYEQWNNMDDTDPAKTELTEAYQTAEGNVAEAEWNLYDFKYQDRLAFERLNRDIAQLKAEIDSIDGAIVAFQDLVDSHTDEQPNNDPDQPQS